MISSTLHIKNMVCNRCIKVVEDELKMAGYNVDKIVLGEARIFHREKLDLQEIKLLLEKNGFELLEDKKVQLIDKIKTLVIDIIHHKNIEEFNLNFSTYLADKTGKDYSLLSNLFSTQEGITIEKFIILQKIERVKEFLVYDELTLSEIAYRMNYSSVAHLSNQFKQITGLTPSQFRSNHAARPRKSLDKLN